MIDSSWSPSGVEVQDCQVSQLEGLCSVHIDTEQSSRMLQLDIDIYMNETTNCSMSIKLPNES